MIQVILKDSKGFEKKIWKAPSSTDSHLRYPIFHTYPNGVDVFARSPMTTYSFINFRLVRRTPDTYYYEEEENLTNM